MSWFKFKYLTILIPIGLVSINILVLGCKKDPDDPVKPNPNDQYDVEIITPRSVPIGVSFPVAIYEHSNHIRVDAWQDFTVNSSPTLTNSREVIVKRGKGAGVFIASQVGDCEINLYSDNILGRINDYSIPLNIIELEFTHEISGTITQEEALWGMDEVIYISDNLTIPSEVELNIQSGVIVLLNTNTNIIIEGAIQIEGTSESPVLFSFHPDAEGWGEIQINNGVGNINWCFFTGGGNDPTMEFGHSESQPVIHLENANIQMNNCFFVDNPGKAVGAIYSEVTLDSCLITRCDTGGEYLFTQLDVNSTWFIDIPNGNGEEVDDDNDAIYVNDPPASSTAASSIKNCVFVTGKDDGIDHNGAILSISNCVIEDFDNEGIAASDKNSLYVYNTFIKDCEQGIEAGYGTPHLIVDHCLFINNEIGIRFGDWYTWRDSEGLLEVTNSISINNSLHNVWNYVMSTELPRDNSLFITYSIVNDSFYDNNEGNIKGTPVFTSEYLLFSSSLGVSAGSDGLNIGLIP